MASRAANLIKLFNFKSYQWMYTNSPRVTTDFIQVRNYAARRGTRERKLKLLRARKSSKKPEEKSQERKHHRAVVQLELKNPRSTEQLKPFCTDDVVVCKYYRWQVYDFAMAIQCHRETLHPTVYNQPGAYVQAYVELDMTAAKKNRFMDNFSRLAPIPHAFPMGQPRSIVVFCKTSELQNEAKEAGADVVGDSDLVKQFEKGDLSIKDYDYVIAHPSILPDLVPIRGLLKRGFPNVRAGTLGVDLKGMVKRFRSGIKYTAKRDEHQKDYGSVEVNFGTLDMEVEHLQENLQFLLRDIYTVHPRRPGPFITRVLVCSSPSPERLKLDLAVILPEQTEVETGEEDSDEEEEKEALHERKTSLSA